MENRKNMKIKLVVCIGLVCLIWGGYFWASKYGVNRILEIVEDDFSWVYQADSVDLNKGEVVLKGFAFQLGMDAEEGKYEIVLQDIDSRKNFFPRMKYTERVEVNEYFLCEYSYLKSGYEAVFSNKKIDLYENEYEVLLRVLGEQKAYRTGTYLSKGELVYANPKEFVAPEVEGTDLEKIVEEGILRVYRPEYSIYAYQYEGELYWIAEPEYEFVESDTIMQYQLGTTQGERLPQHRIENGWSSDNIGFFFSKQELTDWNTGEYRVAKKGLPKEYAITKIWTGNYIGGWKWLQYFRPHYDFEGKLSK